MTDIMSEDHARHALAAMAQALREDPELYHLLQSGIATAFQRTFTNNGYGFKHLSRISEEAASSFIENMINDH